tara:strand:+ start:1299 stop:2342 length:1044 start_codon:yes stop_codon:yes gene_type:complete
MKSANHDKEMHDVYAKIYKDFYVFSEEALNYTRNIIRKNLSESNISLENLKNINVLNIGPAREARVFSELGAKNVFHFDISETAVNALNKLKESNPTFSNIFSNLVDACSPNSLKTKHKIDYVYLAGVLHHLHDPCQAIKNILYCVSPECKLFFRIYRSGSFGFYITDFIRKFITYEDLNDIHRRFSEKFENNNYNKQLAADLHDNFFVPILNLFDPKEIDKFFQKLDFKLIHRDEYVSYEHSSIEHSSQGTTLIYETKDFTLSKLSRITEFPPHLDQINDIKYSEEFILNTNILMNKFLKNINLFSKKEILDLALDLYRESQLYRKKEFQPTEENHMRIQELLRIK